MPEIEGLSYTYNVDDLWSGASFGNRMVFAQTDAISNLTGVWSASDNQWYCGPVRFRFTVRDEELTPMVTRFFPAYQETIYGTEGIIVSQRVFVPYEAGYERAVCWLMEVQAEGPRLLDIAVDIHFLPAIEPVRTTAPPTDRREKRIDVSLNRGLVVAQTVPTTCIHLERSEVHDKEVRVFGSSGPPTVHQFIEPGRAGLRYHVLVEGYIDLPFVLAFSPAGEPVAWQGFLTLSEISSVFDETQKQIDRRLSTSRLYTPDAVINRGLQWAKVNMLRVLHNYRRGPAFTNHPPGDSVVVRDVAWFALGATYLMPDRVGEMLRYVAAEAAYDDGKLAEYFHADTGRRQDYGLNVNDGTALFSIAAQHHHAVTGDDEFLAAIYPAVARAADHILSHIDGGLVRCRAQGTSVYGIAGWRNIIPGYTLNGAVTELNALCVWALRAASEMARALRRTDRAERWADASYRLAETINRRLISEETGLYVLTCDESQRQHTEITGDLVFPLLAGITLPNLRRRILATMHDPAFWTEAGVRTVGANQPEYDPVFGHGLMGGIWPNLTAWVAYAGRHEAPERVAAALHAMYAGSEAEAPGQGGHIVPGQFPEWLHGEHHHSLGMALSPWVAPTYLWLGLEGLAGIEPAAKEFAVNPNLTSNMPWLAGCQIPMHGSYLSFCYLNGVLHTNRPVESRSPVEVYEHIEPVDLTSCFALHLKRGDEQRLFVASADQDVDTHITVGGRRWPVRLVTGEARLFDLYTKRT